MDNLQTEVLELEFYEFSKGNLAITEVDFAKILLRYTYLDTDEYDMYLDRLLDRVKLDRGVSFKEFRDFCQFLNNLEDFSIAMRMYTLADHPISKGNFKIQIMRQIRSIWFHWNSSTQNRWILACCEDLHRFNIDRTSDRHCFCDFRWGRRWLALLQRVHCNYERSPASWLQSKCICHWL